ncbi:glucosamine 6-phosphate N-acetyltransferase isoform X1, partial [Tachysurus ichikawai]
KIIVLKAPNPFNDLCRLVTTLTLLSKKLQCYKITLECSQKNVEFYKKLDYTASEETYMQCRFFE